MFQANCDLRIELERSPRCYRPGERVDGVVHVEVDGETKCDGLMLTKAWGTHGKGNRVKSEAGKVNLFTGTWQPGTYAYPFDFPCPSTPLTYQGHLLNVEWYLEVEADVPWALDPKARESFVVEQAEGGQFDVNPGEVTKASSMMTVFGVLFLIPFFIAGLLILGTAVLGAQPFMGLFSLVWWGILGVVVWQMVKRRMAKQAFRRFSASTRRVDAQHLALDLSYRTGKTINGVTARLEIEEVVVRGSGTDRTTYRHSLHFDEQEREVGHVGENSLEFIFRLPDPGKIGWSFDAVDNDLDWVMVIDVDIDRWPDLQERLPLVVVPRQAMSMGRV